MRLQTTFLLLLVTVSTPTAFAATLSLNGVNYTTSAHPRVVLDGPGGSLDVRIKDPDGPGPGVAPKANNGNPAWVALTTSVTSGLTFYRNTDTLFALRYGSLAAQFALYWYADNSQTAAHDAALYMLNNIQFYLPLVCVETQVDCTTGGTGYGITSYGAAYWIPQWILAYEIMRGEMTSGQRTLFASKMLNDISAFGGIDGSSGVSCTNPTASIGSGTITLNAGVYTLTTAAAVFGTTVNVGDWIQDPQNTTNLSNVVTITDSTHAVLANTGITATTGSDTIYYRPQGWTPGQCGFLWAVKHDIYTAQPVTRTSGSTLYPPTGGDSGSDIGQNLVYSSLWGINLVLMSQVDDDANFATRGGPESTLEYNFWLTGPYSLAQGYMTGFHQSGSGYGLARMQQFMPGFAVAVETSVASPPDLLSGAWAKNMMVSDYANAFPNAQASSMQWGQPDVSGAFGSGMYPPFLDGAVMLGWWFRTSNEGQYFNWWLQNVYAVSGVGPGNVPGTNLGFTATNISNGGLPEWWYLYTDQSYPTLNLSGAPTTFLWNQSATGVLNQRADAVISRTGYASATDTLVNFHAETIPEYDHNVFAGQPSNYGSYKIWKGNYLLAEDFNIDFGGGPNVGGFTIGGTESNYVEVGGTVSNVKVAPPVSAGISRTAGDSTYAYAMADVTAAYTAGAALLRGDRHLLDFKKPGTQQFIIDCVDFLTSTGKSKVAYYHYANNPGTSISVDVVTSNNTHGNTSQLLTKILAPQPVVIATDTSAGQTYRVAVCPSLDAATCDTTNTQAKMLVVHMPVAGSSNVLPAMSLKTPSNFTGVEIDGSSPKYALFANNALTYPGVSFTGAWTGTAQIAIVGLNIGNYTVTLNGSLVSSGSVGAAGVLYFEGAPGAYIVLQSAGVAIQGTKISGALIQ